MFPPYAYPSNGPPTTTAPTHDDERKTVLINRCGGQTAVKGSAKTTLFDFVHLGLHKNDAPTTTVSAASGAAGAAGAGNALKQIVLTGGAGRNRLVLELDGGNTESEAELVYMWFEVSGVAGRLFRGMAYIRDSRYPPHTHYLE